MLGAMVFQAEAELRRLDHCESSLVREVRTPAGRRGCGRGRPRAAFAQRPVHLGHGYDGRIARPRNSGATLTLTLLTPGAAGTAPGRSAVDCRAGLIAARARPGDRPARRCRSRGPRPGPAIALVVVPLIATAAGGPLTRSRPPVGRRLQLTLPEAGHPV
ncbi:hypothetical protein ACQP2P_13375 [Dactylosporangium sp. CA-139114]|uniref:hypothetical protein n=1 Tax=Dactylosporangium sp. CA-139114 TaxID=3239931 RepID=UPI003D989B94